MEKKGIRLDRSMAQRIGVMVLGNLCIGIAVGLYRMGRFGVDSGTCMNLGLSLLVNIQYGHMNVITNILILAVMFFYFRHSIGAGTVINMVGVGYIADFLCWLVQDCMSVDVTMTLRIVFFILATLFGTFGTAVYLDANLGIAPYDALSLMLQKAVPKISFRAARVLVDVIALIIGVVTCFLAKEDMSLVIGLGTVIAALLNGHIIQFFRSRVSPILLKTKE